MLVLTRKEGDTIHVDEGIVFRVLRVEPDQVKIGVEAPQHVKILRGEIVGRSPSGEKSALHRR